MIQGTSALICEYSYHADYDAEVVRSDASHHVSCLFRSNVADAKTLNKKHSTNDVNVLCVDWTWMISTSSFYFFYYVFGLA